MADSFATLLRSVSSRPFIAVSRRSSAEEGCLDKCLLENKHSESLHS